MEIFHASLRNLRYRFMKHWMTTQHQRASWDKIRGRRNEKERPIRMRDFINFILFIVANAFYRSPRFRGKGRLVELTLKLSMGDWLFSTYGVKLKKNWADETFRYCAKGDYGTYLSGFLGGLRSGFSFVDIGANLGIYSLIASRNKAVRKIYAFEPNPVVYEFLTKNAELNRAEITMYPVAISSVEGEQVFRFDRSHTGGGGLATKHGQRISVQSRNFSIFDEIQGNDDNDKVIKIDVEGHEPVVIAELFKSRMEPSIRYIFFEVHEDLYDVYQVDSFLKRHGFRLLHKNGSGLWYDLMYVRSSDDRGKFT